jgi:hypothetical protein
MAKGLCRGRRRRFSTENSPASANRRAAASNAGQSFDGAPGCAHGPRNDKRMWIMRFKILAIVLAATAGLAACGDTVGEQAIIGGAVGAGAAAVTSGSLVTGAAVGAAGNLVYCQTYPNRCR